MNKWILFVLLIIIVPNALALGITPGRVNIDFEPGAEKEISFTVLNSEKEDMNLGVLVQGELKESITVSEERFKMSSNEESRGLKYKIKLPDSLSPGLHTSDIVVIQLPEKSYVSDTFIGAAVGVATQIHIFVLYPGKYAEASLNIIGPESDGKVSFVIPVLSRGKLDLARVFATIDIFNALNEKVASLSTNEVQIQSGERGEIVSTWDTNNIAPGIYRAVARVVYDGEILTIEKQFNIEKKLLELLGIEVNDFSLGGIAKFEMPVENKWSETVVGAYTQTFVYDNKGNAIADFKSQKYDIAPLSKTLMLAFWDTAGIEKGTYDSAILLKYGEQESVQQDLNLKLEILEDKINIIGIGYVISKEGRGLSEGNGLVTIFIIVIVVLVMINVLWFLYLRKRLVKIKPR